MLGQGSLQGIGALVSVDPNHLSGNVCLNSAHMPLGHLEGFPHLFYLINFRPLLTCLLLLWAFFFYSALLPHTSFLFFLFTRRLGIFNLRFPLTSYCPAGTRWGCWHGLPTMGVTVCGLPDEPSLSPHPYPSPLSSPFSTYRGNTLNKLFTEALEIV